MTASGGPARDIVVMGASAGGVEALASVVGGLGAELHAALFVVLHMAADARSALAQILTRVTPLEVVAPRDGEAIRHGVIYVARPNYHLLLERGRVRVLAGPRENGARPAVDPLFRSAAWAYGERVVGVVLSGTLDDGAAGARTIKQHGGVLVGQSDAAFSGMVESVAESVGIDHRARAAEIGPLLTRLAGEGSTTMGAPAEEQAEQLAKREGEASGFTCPECNGSLWEKAEPDGNGGVVVSYECRVEHAYSFETLAAAKAQEVEAAVWAAINALEERAALLRKSAQRARSRGMATPEVPERLLERARESEAQAAAIRRTLLGSPVAVESRGMAGDGSGNGGPVQP